MSIPMTVLYSSEQLKTFSSSFCQHLNASFFSACSMCLAHSSGSATSSMGWVCTPTGFISWLTMCSPVRWRCACGSYCLVCDVQTTCCKSTVARKIQLLQFSASLISSSAASRCVLKDHQPSGDELNAESGNVPARRILFHF